MSRRTFIRRFREETGTTPMAWLTDARIDRARELLEASAVPVEQVGRLTGFGAPASLRAAFHRHLGTSAPPPRNTELCSATRRSRRRPRGRCTGHATILDMSFQNFIGFLTVRSRTLPPLTHGIPRSPRNGSDACLRKIRWPLHELRGEAEAPRPVRLSSSPCWPWRASSANSTYGSPTSACRTSGRAWARPPCRT
ncbi:helix-turn-helix domain-containing protein [Streptomyces sp. NPDC020951]|uniref:helix-turn-helix domain-containing protein n=1 Tax=Streptomyces sp. NPDC020951 TaxID=3365104 RepID=UPI0037A95414